MSVDERERKILDKLYEYTQDDPTKDRSWEAAVKAGKRRSEEHLPKESCLKGALGYVSFNVGLMQIVPGTKLLVAPAVLGVTYSAMAHSAWSVSAHMGVEPTSLEEAQYDLVALTTLWCQKVQPLSAYYTARNALNAALEGESFGKSIIRQLASDGALNVGRKTFGETAGALVGTAFIETVLDPLVSEIWRCFRNEVVENMADEFIPILGRIRSVEKARRRVKEFYELAEEYYDAKG